MVYGGFLIARVPVLRLGRFVRGALGTGYVGTKTIRGAFVTAARNCGFFFCKRVMKEIVIKMSDG
eukprot:1022918-Rhodomonas_salina.1